MCGILKCIVTHNALLWFLCFHMNIGHIIIFLRCSANTWDLSPASVKWGCVITILLYCFLNCLFFFNTMNTIAVEFHYVCVTFYWAQNLIRIRNGCVGVWKRLSTLHHLFMFLCSGCELHRRSSSAKNCCFLRTLRFYLTSFL